MTIVYARPFFIDTIIFLGMVVPVDAVRADVWAAQKGTVASAKAAMNVRNKAVNEHPGPGALIDYRNLFGSHGPKATRWELVVDPRLFLLEPKFQRDLLAGQLQEARATLICVDMKSKRRIEVGYFRNAKGDLTYKPDPLAVAKVLGWIETIEKLEFLNCVSRRDMFPQRIFE